MQCAVCSVLVLRSPLGLRSHRQTVLLPCQPVGDTFCGVVAPTPCLQWQRFARFVAAGDAKEAWLSISASTLQLTLPAALLAAALQGSLWGGAPPPAVEAAGAAACAGAAVAAGTEVWKVLEGFRG